ncbi:serine hydrolase domain-containing protein [Nocardioides massiliensis]|uniref:CubicO group peptidase (Beta-lactamase class C family) n=1 Tax=Nocardioides massiliensis TaxID=1325935 RepID=A0ABT9NSE1_9ACTN|nr:serine hydrolase domain-containing protein [Nocardioides massiliensis]MDP9822960.1 CubicO group peptidase (beta-lactamase class C family) [Nocardioides massiliensis]
MTRPAVGERAQALVDRLQAGGRLPSLVLGVLRDGELAWSGGAGDLVGPVEQTRYRIGSITKTLVAVAILRLRDAGLLDLDDPLRRHLDAAAYGEVTVRQLLAHTGGLQSEPVGPWWERSPGVDRDRLLAANDGSGAVTAPGSWFHYSNLGHALLGAVLEEVRGRGWWEVVAAEVLAPLGMDTTSYDACAPHAQGYSVDHFLGTTLEEPHHATGAMAPAGQAWSTIADLARWARFLSLGHPDVLAETTLAEMARRQPPAPAYGLGVRLLDVDGRTWVGHTGSMPGFLASCFVDRTNGDGVVALANATIGLPTADLPRLLCEDPAAGSCEPWRPTTVVPPLVAELAGLWFWGTTAVELRWSNDRLELRTLANGVHSDTFVLAEDGAVRGVEGYHRGEVLQAHRDPTGRVEHLECATFRYTRTPYGR